MIVHSELSDPEGDTDSDGGDDEGPFAAAATPPNPGEGPQEPAPSSPAPEAPANHNGPPQESGAADRWTQPPVSLAGAGLTNGFHAHQPLENGDSFQPGNGLLRPGKGLPLELQPAPSPFAGPGLVHSTSAAHSYLCP